jgi:hypothetical protein
MGKQTIDRLLTKLQDSHEQDIHNAAAIFTVAQGAVNQLQNRSEIVSKTASDAATQSTVLAAKQLAPLQLTQAELMNRYGNYNACRAAAKRAGITFSRSPRWTQIVAAFNYLEACQASISAYLQHYPNRDLQGTKITITLG